MHKEEYYNENAQVKLISRTKEYTTEDGQKGTETEIYKKVYGGKHFYRVWLTDLLMALGMISNSKQMDVVFHVLENVNPSTNMFIGTVRAISDKTKISTKTVNLAINKMLGANIMRKVQNGVYLVNGAFIIQGGEGKKHKIIQEYEALPMPKAKDGVEHQLELVDIDGNMVDTATGEIFPRTGTEG